MKLLLPILLFISSLPAIASCLPGWANAEAAQLHAEAALIEWSKLSYPHIDRTRLASQPLVLARIGSGGEKIVQVVYGQARGSYVVTMVVDSDGYLRVFGQKDTIEQPNVIADRFRDPTFDPSSLLEEG